MTCKCGKEAELQQENIFGEVDELCRDCFDKLGHHDDDQQEDEDGTVIAYTLERELGR